MKKAHEANYFGRHLARVPLVVAGSTWVPRAHSVQKGDRPTSDVIVTSVHPMAGLTPLDTRVIIRYVTPSEKYRANSGRSISLKSLLTSYRRADEAPLVLLETGRAPKPTPDDLEARLRAVEDHLVLVSDFKVIR